MSIAEESMSELIFGALSEILETVRGLQDHQCEQVAKLMQRHAEREADSHRAIEFLERKLRSIETMPDDEALREIALARDAEAARAAEAQAALDGARADEEALREAEWAAEEQAALDRARADDEA